MIVKFKIISLSVLILFLSFGVFVAKAAGPGIQNAVSELRGAGAPAFGEEAAQYAGGATGLAERIGKIINIFLAVLGGIFLILLIYGGYTWMIARGDVEKVKKAKEVLIDAVIGLIIIFAAYAISAFVVQQIIDATNPTGTPSG